MSRLEFALVACVVVVAGCSSNNGKTKPDDGPTSGVVKRKEYANPIVGPFESDDDLYANIPEDKVKIKDSDVKFGNDKETDFEKVAKWATERRDLITWLVHEEVTEINDFGQAEHRYKRVWPDDPARPETRLDQAIAIGNRVVEKVPSNTRERVRLAWCLFYRGSDAFWAVDACMNRINLLKAKHGDNEKDPAIKDEVERLYATAARESRDMLKYHKAALNHFQTYMSAMPMDKAPLDFIWKIHFQLGDFREAVRYMNLLLDEDMLKDEMKESYLRIRREINEYLVDREINKETRKPNSAETMRAVGRELGGER